MSEEINLLKERLIDAIESGRDSVDTIQMLLLDEPVVQQMIHQPGFVDDMKVVFEILTADVDGDGELTAKDLQITLSQSIPSLCETFEIFTAIITRQPQTVDYRLAKIVIIRIANLTYLDTRGIRDRLPQLVFKTLAYLLLNKIFIQNSSIPCGTKVIVVKGLAMMAERLIGFDPLIRFLDRLTKISLFKKCLTCCKPPPPPCQKAQDKAMFKLEQTIKGARMVESQQRRIIELETLLQAEVPLIDGVAGIEEIELLEDQAGDEVDDGERDEVSAEDDEPDGVEAEIDTDGEQLLAELDDSDNSDQQTQPSGEPEE